MSPEDSLVLGRYRVLGPLGSTKLIRTYIARDERRGGLGTPVLIKQYLHDLGDREAPLASVMFHELNRLTQLRHPGIVSLLDYGSAGPSIVTAHAHLPGVGLDHLCASYSKKQEQFPPDLAIYIVRRLLDTLQHCHTRSGGQFVHGRLTLGCIHLTATGQPQIGDFGLAALEEVATEAEMQLGFFQTRMSYSAPELTRGGAASPQGDAYSVALLLYRLLAGSNPFRGRSIPETLQRVLQLSPADLLMPKWPGCARANAVLRRALDKDPSVRFQSCHELNQALGALQTQSDETLNQELCGVVRRHAPGGSAQMARPARSRRRDPSSAEGDAQTSRASLPMDSKGAAFVSGLITAQPVSRAQRRAEEQRAGAGGERRVPRLMLPTVLIPAAAIMVGLFLGRLGGVGVGASALPSVPARDGHPARLVNGMVEDLRAQLGRCAGDPELAREATAIELEFGPHGTLAGVRLEPDERSHSRVGACLLEIAWKANPTVPGAMSVKIPLR